MLVGSYSLQKDGVELAQGDPVELGSVVCVVNFGGALVAEKGSRDLRGDGEAM